MSKKIAQFAALGLLLVATVFFIVAAATPGWIKVTVDGVSESDYKGNIGLWKTCVKANGSTQCNDLKTDCHTDGETDKAKQMCNKLQATRAFTVMAVIIAAFSLAAVGLFAFVMSGNATVSMVGLAFAAIAGVFGLLAMAIWASFEQDYKDQTSGSGATIGFDYSFGLLIVAWIFSFFAAGAFGYSKSDGGATNTA